ncbi:glycosyltransferase family 8 protein [Weissella viridescens]|uniref:Glycosyltransferase family 8 protein n=1 Tax=Weissella viridescens TaxID=1629 RepID=A0A3P2RM32_WEIVI|nr:glycosyltransferase family 8 protein [Weissella viridescens]RRG18742.1 glycosyltransferase family 8 protein [Weissella viridescens]
MLMSIASTTDDNNTVPLSVLYTSILENNSDVDFDFYIVNDHLSAKNQNLLKAFPKVFKNCQSVSFLDETSGYYAKANASSPDSAIKKNTYYRIEIPEQVDVPRLLYLDCDMVCLGDLKTLWETDLHGQVVGAVEDQGYVKRLQEMGIDARPGRYFNAGLLLIDVVRWRAENITEKTRKLCNEHPEKLRYQDQDALNAIFEGDWVYINPKYNLQSHLAKGEGGKNPLVERQAIEQVALDAPIIVHYTNFDKPWLVKENHLHPLLQYYYDYLDCLIHAFGDFITTEIPINE